MTHWPFDRLIPVSFNPKMVSQSSQVWNAYDLNFSKLKIDSKEKLLFDHSKHCWLNNTQVQINKFISLWKSDYKPEPGRLDHKSRHYHTTTKRNFFTIKYRCFLISTWNQTDFQTHFAPILDLLSDCFDCEQVENKWYFDIDFSLFRLTV